MDISIIVVNWNTQKLLYDCLESIYAHTENLTFEIIVVDNASSDDSVGMVKNNFPDVILVENESNRGFAVANNQGMAIANGRYVLLLNSDTVIFDNALNKAVSFADAHSKVGVVGCRVLNSDGTLESSCFMFPSILNMILSSICIHRIFPRSRFFGRERMSWYDWSNASKVDAVAGCFMLVRREAIEQVGLMDERFFIYGEDTDWCRRFHTAGWDVMFYPEAEVIHVGGASSSKDPIKFYLEMLKADMQYWRKHHGKFGKVSYIIVLLLREVLRVIARAFQYVFCISSREMIFFKLRCSLACIRWICHF
jgi:GT2 family glycosyltransferase